MSTRRVDELPAKLVCDFCSLPDPEWLYPCRDFDMFTLPTDRGREFNRSTGGWGACNACSDAIELSVSEESALDHLIEIRRKRQGLDPLLGMALASLWIAFFEHRAGARIRVTDEMRQEALPHAIGSRIETQAQIDRMAVHLKKRGQGHGR